MKPRVQQLCAAIDSGHAPAQKQAVSELALLVVSVCHDRRGRAKALGTAAMPVGCVRSGVRSGFRSGSSLIANATGAPPSRTKLAS